MYWVSVTMTGRDSNQTLQERIQNRGIKNSMGATVTEFSQFTHRVSAHFLEQLIACCRLFRSPAR